MYPVIVPDNHETGNKMREVTTDIIRFKTTLPFYPSERQIIYVENAYDDVINGFIQENYEALCRQFSKKGYEFCYFPYLSKKLTESSFVQYFTPYQSVPVRPYIGCELLLPYLKRGYSFHPSLLLYDSRHSNGTTRQFSAFNLADKENCLDIAFSSLISKLKDLTDDSDLRYCTTSLAMHLESPDDYADEQFSEEVTRLMKEVQEKISSLRQHGVNELILRSLLNPKVKLSRLRIINNRIYLPDYGNREIKMAPLVKAVYFLFLRHPEGLLFKSLPLYRSELFAIYTLLTGRSSIESVRQSIQDVTDPCKNSINEKCARIREAFIREFDDSLAENYYVTGCRGCKKAVLLPQELIEWC